MAPELYDLRTDGTWFFAQPRNQDQRVTRSQGDNRRRLGGELLKIIDSEVLVNSQDTTFNTECTIEVLRFQMERMRLLVLHGCLPTETPSVHVEFKFDPDTEFMQLTIGSDTMGALVECCLKFQNLPVALEDALQIFFEQLETQSIGKTATLDFVGIGKPMGEALSNANRIPKAALRYVQEKTEYPIESDRAVLTVRNVRGAAVSHLYDAFYRGEKAWQHVQWCHTVEDVRLFYAHTLAVGRFRITDGRDMLYLDTSIRIEADLHDLQVQNLLTVLGQYIIPRRGPHRPSENDIVQIVRAMNTMVHGPENDQNDMIQSIMAWTGAFRGGFITTNAEGLAAHNNNLMRRLRCVSKNSGSTIHNKLTPDVWALMIRNDCDTEVQTVRSDMAKELRQNEHIPQFMDNLREVIGLPLSNVPIMEALARIESGVPIPMAERLKGTDFWYPELLKK